jgi:ATP-dependent DNA ligase
MPGRPCHPLREPPFSANVVAYCPAPKRPSIIEPCIPTLATKPPVGPQWIHEIKHDGYRLIARKRDGRVRLFTRRGYDWTGRYPLICEAVAAIQVRSVVIDGEAVYCDAAGVSVFDELHSRAYDDHVILYAFDVIELDRIDQRPCRTRGRPRRTGSTSEQCCRRHWCGPVVGNRRSACSKH